MLAWLCLTLSGSLPFCLLVQFVTCSANAGGGCRACVLSLTHGNARIAWTHEFALTLLKGSKILSIAPALVPGREPHHSKRKVLDLTTTYRLSSHARLEAFVIQTKLNNHTLPFPASLQGMQALYGLKNLPSPSEMAAIASSWQPWQSVGVSASWKLW